MGMRILMFPATPDKKAKYKELLLDWVKGIIILYFFPYVIRYTIEFNHAFVTYIKTSSKDVLTVSGATIQGVDDQLDGIEKMDDIELEKTQDKSYMTTMYEKAKKSQRITDAVVWVIMIIQVAQFLIVYMQRLITVIFLIAIFPLVVISYAIDKIGDGKSQAFNNWVKEFVLQVFIQTFHAVNYVLIMGIVLKLGRDNWFLEIVGITYVAKGGDILKGLFAQMKGGAGKDGGPLEVAKTMMKTQMAISGIKAIGGVASRTIGPKSVLGKGAGKLWDARNTYIERNAARAEREAHDVASRNNITARNRINDLLHPGAATTPDEMAKQKELEQKALEYLGTLSPEELNRVMADMKLTDAEMRDLTIAISYAANINNIRNRRNRSNITVRNSVEAVIQFRQDPSVRRGNRILDRYMDATDEDFSNDKLRKVAAAHSVTFASSAGGAVFDEAPADEASKAEKMAYLDESLKVLEEAYEGGHTEEELVHRVHFIQSARKDKELSNIIQSKEKSMSFIVDDFETNLATQIINNSNRGEVYTASEDERSGEEGQT